MNSRRQQQQQQKQQDHICKTNHHYYQRIQLPNREIARTSNSNNNETAVVAFETSMQNLIKFPYTTKMAKTCTTNSSSNNNHHHHHNHHHHSAARTSKHKQQRTRANATVANRQMIMMIFAMFLASVATFAVPGAQALGSTMMQVSNISSSNHHQQMASPVAQTGASGQTLPAILLAPSLSSSSTANAKSLPESQHQSNSNSSDINNDHKPLEQVAKAEALVSPPVAAAMIQVAQSSGSTSASLAQNAKAFQICKSQSRNNLQLTNLSQIVFQPSDVCSSWVKMLRTTTSSSDMEPSSNPWYHIELLNLSANNLTVLHDSSSSGLNRLVNINELRITHNQLTRCEESSLNGLNNLQTLDLSHNKLMGLPTKFLQPIKNTLKKLVLSHNSISVLVPTLFDSLTKLEHLDLSHNEITSHWFDDRLFMNLTQLHYLDLSFNKLTVFSSPMTFSSLQQLETLSLQHNELRQVPETIQYLRFLSSLDLSQNLIHDITNASYLSNCKELFNLNLESNLLESINRDAFSDLPALKVLNLANNRIQHLDKEAFECKCTK